MAESELQTETGRAGYRSRAGNDISVSEILAVLVKNKKLVAGLPSLVAFAVAISIFFMPDVYTGRAVLMPPQQQQSSSAMMMAQLGFIANLAGSGLTIKNPNDMYAGILRSRTIADALIGRFDLQKQYGEDTLVDTRRELAARTTIAAGRDNLIVIEVDDKDPERAADIANGYAEELEKLSSTLAVTEAGQRRLFFERQLAESKDDLGRAEVRLKETQEKTGLVQLDQQGRAMIEAVATLRAQIVAREVELAAMRAYATDTNPELVKLRQEVTSLHAELRKVERGGGGGDLFVPTGKIPAAGLEYVRKYRDVKYAETVFELLARQYEMAKLDEARDSAVIQLVDRAVAPDKKSKPPRTLIVVIFFLLSFFLVCAYVLRREYRRSVGTSA